MKKVCANCQFFEQLALECHRFPPMRGEGWLQGRTYPPVDGTDWCGEFTKRK